MEKVFLKRAEFYITNVCNYNCDQCNRLNNFYFSGHQLWDDYKDIYQQWSSVLELELISILGGEPLLNPSLIDWVNGIRKLWPNATIDLLTNGTRLKYWPTLYQVIKDNHIELSIQLHNRDRHAEYIEYLKTDFFKSRDLKFQYRNQHLSGWVNAYQSVKDDSWPNCNSIEDFENLPEHIKQECTEIHKIDPNSFMMNSGAVIITDDQGVTVELDYSEDFWLSPLQYSGNNQFDVYNSDPVKAHDVCPSKYCHHFVKGKLYKCHHVVLLPEFEKQFYVNLSPEDRQLLEDYKPLLVDYPRPELQKLVDELKDVIPQCKLCPDEMPLRQIKSSIKKIKIVKKPKS